ncbi:MAG TPA: prepilin-type N-terminal cleavage/methylation domain-containing protein [Candidatus Omnitrophota bacterium]|nr:prepilin-type N-terminal cleavage/methylation domain-containing protein [Candidatus Omnitrophota bacterium]
MKHAKGFTILEVVMTILIIALLTVGSLHISKFVINNTFYLPSQVNADLTAASAMETMIEGDVLAKGLRFSKAVTTASPNQIIVTNQDDHTISYRLDVGLGKLYRKIDTGAEALVPDGAASDMVLAGVSGALFTYYDANEAVTNTAADVRRIAINLIAQNGTGSSDNLEGMSQQSSSVQVNKYI